MALETLYPGLAAAKPEALIAVAEHLLEIERQNPRRWFGFGGEVKVLKRQSCVVVGKRDAAETKAGAKNPLN